MVLTNCKSMRRVITEQDVPARRRTARSAGDAVHALGARPGRRARRAHRGTSRRAAQRHRAAGEDHRHRRRPRRLPPEGSAQAGARPNWAWRCATWACTRRSRADYPDIAEKVAELVASGAAARGVIIDGAGIGSSIAANKVPGVRAALCYDKASARNSREHNDSNVLTLGGRLLTATQAEDVLRTWLATPFAGGRHAARVDKITEIEQTVPKVTPAELDQLVAQIGEEILARIGQTPAPPRAGAPRRAKASTSPTPVCPGCVQRCAQTCRTQHQAHHRGRRRPRHRQRDGSPRSIPPSRASSITRCSSRTPPAATSSRSARSAPVRLRQRLREPLLGAAGARANWPARRSRCAPWSASRWAPPPREAKVAEAGGGAARRRARDRHGDQRRRAALRRSRRRQARHPAAW